MVGHDPQKVEHLLDEWDYAEVPTDLSLTEIASSVSSWTRISVPTTIRKLEQCSDADNRRFIFRCLFPRPTPGPSARLIFNGLATRCNVWLNDNAILTSRNMFRRHTVDVGDFLRDENVLLLDFHPLAEELRKKRPRPRWKTRLVQEQALRFERTTLLGRIPGWAPGGGPVGPFRSVELLPDASIRLDRLQVVGLVEGSSAKLRIQAAVVASDSPKAHFKLSSPSGEEVEGTPLTLQPTSAGRFEIDHMLEIESADLWWPHTHGEPKRYGFSLEISNGQDHVTKSGFVGFRSVSFDQHGGAVIKINGQPIFCRGSCWTTLDLDSLSGSSQEYRDVLGLVRESGMNMLRLTGAMIYEQPIFYELCDELGIMVWQDFMFANLDYPSADDDFMDEVSAEASDFLQQHAGHACLTILCGGSEVAQQAAMMGLPQSDWISPLFAELLPSLADKLCPNIPYVANSPLGMPLPFHTKKGISHYFGVGAYLRPLSDVNLARPEFASECLAFSNVPSESSLLSAFESHEIVPHHPKYKAGVARDNGVGWDFADVTDHYLGKLFLEDPAALRYSDPRRYFELARLVPGEIMTRVFGYLRTDEARCGGALVWFLKDLIPGAGWGVIDQSGEPKPVYYYLTRALQDRAVALLDRGLNGVDAVVFNDTSEPLHGELTLRCFRDSVTEIASARIVIDVDARSQVEHNLEQLLGRFIDASYAYRFGPPGVAAIHAELQCADAPRPTATADYVPLGLANLSSEDLKLEANASPTSDGAYILRVSASGYCYAIRISARGYRAADDYFHLAPGSVRNVTLLPEPGAERLTGFVKAANCPKSARIVAKTS